MRVLHYLRSLFARSPKDELGQTLLLPRDQALKLARKQIQTKRKTVR